MGGGGRVGGRNGTGCSVSVRVSGVRSRLETRVGARWRRHVAISGSILGRNTRTIAGGIAGGRTVVTGRSRVHGPGGPGTDTGHAPGTRAARADVERGGGHGATCVSKCVAGTVARGAGDVIPHSTRIDQSHARNDFGSRVSFFAREGKSAFVQFSSTLVSERWWCGADGASRVRGRARGVDVRRRFQQRVGVLLYVASVSPRPSFFSFRWCFMFSLESLQSNAPSKPRLTRLPCVFPQPRRFS